MRPAVILTALLLMVPPSIQALELGDLELDSAPGAPLSGRLAIIDAGADALDEPEVGLATDRTHAKAGIKPLALPPALKLIRNESTPARVRVTTVSPPGLTEAGATFEFLVRLRGPQGQMLRPRAVTTNQIMLALLAGNPASFNADNINALQRDAFLTAPRGEALAIPDESTATKRVRAQQEAWQTDDDSPMLELLPAAAVANAQAQDVGQALEPLEAQLDRLETSNESLSEQNRSLQATLSQLQSDVLRLEDLLADSMSSPRPTDTVTAAMVRAWLIDRAQAAIANPYTTLRMPEVQWMLGATAFLLLVILLRMRRRRRRRARQDGAAAMPPHRRPPGDHGADQSEVTEPTLGDARVRPLDDAPEDPLARASELIAYGQLEKAQSVLDEALGEEPDSVDLRLKLLDVLAMRNDLVGFESEAHVLQAQINDPGDERWQRIVIRGREFAPDSALFRS